MLLHHAFERMAEAAQGKVALVEGTRRIDYGELLRQTRALAHALRGDGIVAGDRVLVFLESSIEYAVAVHAVLMIGGVFVPIHPLAKGERLAFIAADTRARALLTHAQLAPVWSSMISQAPHLVTVRVVGPHESRHEARVTAWPGDRDPAPPISSPCIDQDLAALIYTSGTTGTPKAAMLTHLNMLSAWNSVQEYLGLRASDVIGLALPPAFSYGLYYLLMGLGLGATVVLERLAVFPIKLLESLEREQVTVFPGVPSLFAAVLGVTNLSRYELGSLRLLTNAAAALPEAHLHRLCAAFPRARLYSMYGMTECKRISYLVPEDIETRPTSVGRGMPNQEHWLVDEEGRRLPDGSTGELVVRGSHVMRGYWERPAETAERLKPGPIPGEMVLYTGDLFRTDADGYLYFVSRKDDIIKTRGEKVAPREVENTIHRLEDVASCAVVGVGDEALGQAVKAFVVLRPGSPLTSRDIIRHCLAHLESYMAPKQVEIVDELPRTESGKIRHASLRG